MGTAIAMPHRDVGYDQCDVLSYCSKEKQDVQKRQKDELVYMKEQ